MKLSVTNRLPITTVIMFLLLLAILLMWNARQSEKEFTAYQYSLMEKSVNGVSSEISNQIESLHTSLSALAERYQNELQRFASNPEELDLYNYISEQIAKYYPDYFTFTIADSEGELFYDDFGERIGDLCRSDIRQFVQNQQFSTIIHPGPSEYHFDIMLPWSYNSKMGGVFFASFKPSMFSRILRTSEVPGHKLMLIRTDVDGLIDISAQGVRPDFTRDIHLSDDEQERVTHSKTISHTRWALIALPDETIFSNYKRKIYYEAIVIFAAFAVISILMLFLIMRKEMQRSLAEYTLRMSRDELESANKRVAHLNESLQAHMRDLHDDVGAKLLTLSHRCKNPVNADTARSALTDLRETIHDLGKQGTTVPLTHVLADLRAEMLERTETANIDFQWSQPNKLTDNDYLLGFRQRINLVRIFREALSNAIRHSEVTNIHVDIFIDDELRALLCNNGLVEEITGWTPGTGMLNMRKRAEELDGKINWFQPPVKEGSTSKINCIEISCPLPEKGSR